MVVGRYPRVHSHSDAARKMKKTANDNKLPWYQRTIIFDWTATSIIGTLVVCCIPVAFFAGLFLTWWFQGGGWWIMSVIAVIVLMAG